MSLLGRCPRARSAPPTIVTLYLRVTAVVGRYLISRAAEEFVGVVLLFRGELSLDYPASGIAGVSCRNSLGVQAECCLYEDADVGIAGIFAGRVWFLAPRARAVDDVTCIQVEVLAAG